MGNQKHVVHKSNDLIEAKFNLPLIEQRILAVCVSKINPTKNKLENPYRFSIKEYCTLTGSDSKGLHEKIKSALERLQSRTLVKYDPDSGGTTYCNWTRKITAWDSHSYDVYFDEEIEADLLAKTKYTEYLLKSAFSLKSKYSLRLYEVVKQRKGQARAPVFSVEKLRHLLGVDEDSYSEYRDFKRRCLKLAIEEINEHTDLNIKINEFRKDRKVGSIELIITESKIKIPKIKDLREKEKTKKHDGPDLFDLLDPQSDLDTIIEKLQPLGIRARQCMKLIEEFTGPAVLLAHEKVLALNFKEGINLAGVLINTLKDTKEANEAKATLATKSKDAGQTIDKNREWWNGEGLETLWPFWDDDNPYMLKGYPSRVASERHCWLMGSVVNFGDDDFREKVIQTVTDLTAKRDLRDSRSKA